MNFHSKLLRLRAFHQLTQQEMAKKWGVTKAAYAKYETGDRSPDKEKLGKLAETFDLDLNSLIFPYRNLLIKQSLPDSETGKFSRLLDSIVLDRNFDNIVSKLTDIQEAHNYIIDLLTVDQNMSDTNNSRDDVPDLSEFADGRILVSYQKNEEVDKLLKRSIELQGMLLKSLNNLPRVSQ